MAALIVGATGSVLLLLVFGCHTEPGLAGCEGVRDPIAREECRYDAIKPLVADDAALRAAVDSMTDSASRDLVLLRLAFDRPERAQALCRMVKTPPVREKCDKVVGRPHIAGPSGARPSP
ncbi:MAG: hypothetical protein Q8P18_24415 [Pseudomonadota bacterium]|nr:hypothetical protein [Pseudomonadota bacterium]